jgi:hypothetical protein
MLIVEHNPSQASSLTPTTIQSNTKTPPTKTLTTNNQHNANMSAQEIPTGDFQDNEYQSRTGQSEIPVQADDKPVEDPIDPDTADSDAQLGRLIPLFLSSLERVTNSLRRGRREECHRPKQHHR